MGGGIQLHRRALNLLGSSVLSSLGAKTFPQETGFIYGTTEFTLGAGAQMVGLTGAMIPGGAGTLAIGGEASTEYGGYVAAEEAGFIAGTPAAGTSTQIDDSSISNTVLLRDELTDDKIETEDGEEVFGLLHAANGSADGDAMVFGAGVNVQLSFVYRTLANPNVLANYTLPAGTYYFSARQHTRLHNLPYHPIGGGAAPDALSSPWEIIDNNIRLVGPAHCQYTTINDAMADWNAGESIWVFPGTYAENLTGVPDGCDLVAVGPVTVGTAGDHSVEIDSPVGGEYATFTGPWTFAAAGGSIDAAAGAYLKLTDEVEILGAVTGVYRVGRRWVLQSGEALATYIPGGGGVIADIEEGDQLLHLGLSTPDWLTLLDIGGTTYWSSPRGWTSSDDPFESNRTSDTFQYYSFPNFDEADKLFIERSCDCFVLDGGGADHTVGHHFEGQIITHFTTTSGLYSTAGQSTNEKAYTYEIGQIVDMYTDGELIGHSLAYTLRKAEIETGAVDSTDIYLGNIQFRMLWE